MGRTKKYSSGQGGERMTEGSKWQIEGWGAAQGQIQEAIEFLCNGKPPSTRAIIAEELVALVRSLARGQAPRAEADPFNEDERSRESWARGTAHHVVDGALYASERSAGASPTPDQRVLLRELARRALWLGRRGPRFGPLGHDGKPQAAESVR